MTTSTTVNTNIVIKFEDKFTEEACQATETYKKCLEGALQLQSKSAEGARSLDLFSQGFERFENDADKLNTALLALGLPAFLLAFGALPISIGIVIGSLAALYGIWKSGEELPELKAGGKPMPEAIDDVSESLEKLAKLKTSGFPLIPPETIQSLEALIFQLEQIQALQDIFITVNLIDNATKEAKQLRQEIEGIFSQDIVQRIKVIEERSKLTIPSFSGGSDSIFSDAPIELQTPSVDLTGFSDSVNTSPSSSTTVPGFSSGIERVPRDMLAMIHKDEAVLPKNQAEDFRRGGSNGVSVQKLEFNIHAPNVLNLDRQTVGDLALTIRDEIQRIDQRA